MEIVHDEAKKQFKVEVDGYTAHVAYQLTDDGGLDIRHTIVPEEIGGRGIASALVKAAYDYARCKCLKPVATCAYAVVWLQRHPEYQGDVSCDYGGKGTEGVSKCMPSFFYDKTSTFPSRGFVMS